MKEETKKQTATGVVTGVGGFLIGYFWPRKKQPSGWGIELSNLVIDPPSAFYSEAGTDVTISVEALNTGPATDAEIVVHIDGNDSITTTEHFEAGELKTLTWAKNLPNFRTWPIWVSVNPIRGEFIIIDIH
jgi:hypothetical protein